MFTHFIMKTTTLLTVCLISLSLFMVSCKKTKKNNTPDKSGSELTVKNDSVEPSTTDYSKTAVKLITENEGQYPRDLKIFKDKDIANRLKKIAGADYPKIIENFDTETPIVSLNGIYKFTGCKQHNCPSFHTTILYDAHHDNFNIIIEKNGRIKVYDEKGNITMTKALKLK